MIAFLAIPFLLIQSLSPLAIEPAKKNFEDCKAGQMLSVTFELTNTGSSTLEITRVATVCGCQQTKLDQKTLKSGEKTSLQFSINTLTQAAGRNQWKATIHHRSNGVDGESEVFITANIVREIDVNPVQIAAIFESSFESTIAIHDKRSKPMPVVRVVSGISILETSIGKMSADGKQSLQLSVKKDAAPGEYSGHLQLVTNDLDYPDLKVPIRLVKNAAGAVSVHPDKLTLRWNAGQPTVSGLFVLRSKEEGKSFEIEKVECDSPSVKTKFAVANGVGSVRATLDTKDLKSGETELRIHLKESEERIVKIPLKWESP